MKVDLSCPIELWAYALPTEEKTACSFTFFNLGERLISSVQITVTYYGAADETLTRRIERPMALEARGRAPFTVEVSAEGFAVEAANLSIDKVWFADGEEWRRAQEARFLTYEPNELPENRKLEQLRYLAGGDAVGFPNRQKGVWVCVCGRVNAEEETVCRRCERAQAVVFERYTEEAVRRAIDARERALEDKARQAREEASRQEFIRQEKARRKRRGRRMRTAVVCVTLALLAVTYLFVVLGIPEIRYQTALSDFTAGETEKARAAFADLLAYRDAAERVEACDLRIAAAHIESGEGARIDTALSILQGLTDRPEAAELMAGGRYKQAALAMEGGDYAGAAERFEALGEYLDAADLAKQCRYQIAQAALAAEDYERAKPLFEALGAYLDAADMAKECVYRPAGALQAAGDYEEAIALYTLILEYRDAANMRFDCIYRSALNLQLEGDLEKAAERFMLCGDYADSREQVRVTIYLAANQARDAGSYDIAEGLYRTIAGYEDADTQAMECVYRPAQALMAEREYAAAAQRFAKIPEYLDAKTLHDACVYALGEAARDAGDLTAAIGYFSQIEGYEDAAAQGQQAAYKQAEGLAAQGETEAAIAAFEALGEYDDAAARAVQTRYTLAEEAFAEGLFSLASDRFAALGDYEDAQTRVLDCAYELALLMYEGDDIDGAYAAMIAIADYPKAAQEAKRLAYVIGQAKYATGDLVAAREAFTLADDYSDARTRVRAITYNQALTLMSEAEYEAAGALFQTLDDYEDARAKRDECYDLLLAETAEAARSFYEAEAYQEAIDALSGVTLEGLPRAYADLETIYLDANYQLARGLIAEDRALEAYGYLIACRGYKSANTMLDKNIYRILGTWAAEDGATYAFYLNAGCVIAGEARVFNMRDAYGIQTGTDIASLARTHSFVGGGEETLTLREEATGKNMRLTRVAPPQVSPTARTPEAPTAEETATDPDWMEEEGAAGGAEP